MLEIVPSLCALFFVYFETHSLTRATSWLLLTNASCMILSALCVLAVPRLPGLRLITDAPFMAFCDGVLTQNGTLRRVFAQLLLGHGTVRFFAALWLDVSPALCVLGGVSFFGLAWMFFTEFLLGRVWFWPGFVLTMANFSFGLLCLASVTV
jgi:hypothetical protein